MTWRPSLPPWLMTAGKILITLSCVWYLNSVVPITALTHAFSNLGLMTTVVLISIISSRELATSFSLKILIDGVSQVDFWTAIKIDCMGVTANTFIPSRAGALVSTPLLLLDIQI